MLFVDMDYVYLLSEDDASQTTSRCGQHIDHILISCVNGVIVTVSQYKQHQDTETKAAKRNTAITNCITNCLDAKGHFPECFRTLPKRTR